MEVAPSLEDLERMGQGSPAENEKHEEGSSDEEMKSADSTNALDTSISIKAESTEDLALSLLRCKNAIATCLTVNTPSCKLGSTEIQMILEAFPALAELSLDGLEIDSEAFGGGTSGLKVIRIRMGSMSVPSFSLRAFSVHAPNVLLLSLASHTLQELELSFAGEKRLHFLQSCHLATFLTKSPSLQTLKLANLYGMSSKVGRGLIESSNNALRCLRLENCILESRCMRELLEPSHELEDVRLSNCILHPGAVAELQAATNCRWKYCTLDHVKLGLVAKPEALDSFLRNAFCSVTLRCLTLRLNDESQIQASTIHDLLAQNPNLAQLSGIPLDSTALFRMGLNSVAYYDTSPNRFDEDHVAWMSAVTQLADPQQQSLSSLFVFLREHPRFAL